MSHKNVIFKSNDSDQTYVLPSGVARYDSYDVIFTRVNDGRVQFIIINPSSYTRHLIDENRLMVTFVIKRVHSRNRPWPYKTTSPSPGFHYTKRMHYPYYVRMPKYNYRAQNVLAGTLPLPSADDCQQCSDIRRCQEYTLIGKDPGTYSVTSIFEVCVALACDLNWDINDDSAVRVYRVSEPLNFKYTYQLTKD